MEIPNDVVDVVDEKKFRFQAKKLGLTYPQCSLSPSKLLEFLESLAPIKSYSIGREKHKDGNFHLHAYIEWSDKFETRDVRKFDFDGHHPNILTPKKGWEGYVRKGGDFIHNEYLNYKSTGFLKRKQDFDAFNTQLKKNRRLDITYPITLFNRTITKPDPAIKKRHFWFWGAPDLGKTYKTQQALKGLKFYEADANYEEYNGEDIILIDDRPVTFDEIAAVANTYPGMKPIYGQSRYFTRFWPSEGEPGGCRTIIVLNNQPPQYGVKQAMIEARFNIVELTHEDCV